VFSVYCIVLCTVVPLPPGTYPLAVNNDDDDDDDDDDDNNNNNNNNNNNKLLLLNDNHSKHRFQQEFSNIFTCSRINFVFQAINNFVAIIMYQWHQQLQGKSPLIRNVI
jgi:hypothetical protein